MKRTPLQRHTPLRAQSLRKVTKADLPQGYQLKRKRPKSTPARKAAQDKPCMIRLPGCDGGGETTVLAHYRMAGTCGVGMKPDDEQGAWACHSCHAIVDGRQYPPPGYTTMAVRLAHAEGCFRTQMMRRSYP